MKSIGYEGFFQVIFSIAANKICVTIIQFDSFLQSFFSLGGVKIDYDTALRAYTSKRVEEIDSADFLVGIPCYNNENTIEHVIQMVTHGLATHYKDKRRVIFITDGGSTDDTCEVAKEFQIKP